MEAAAAQHRPNPAPEDMIEKLPRTELTYDGSPLSFLLSFLSLSFVHSRSSEERPIMCDLHRILRTPGPSLSYHYSKERGSVRDRAGQGQGNG
jgi:hypothetical protein